MPSFLPLLDQADDRLLSALARIGPIILPALQSTNLPEHPTSRYVLADHDTSVDLGEIIRWLDEGATKVVVPLAWAKEIIGIIPADRLLLLIDVGNVSAVSDTVRNAVSGVILKSTSIDPDLVAELSQFFVNIPIHVLSTSSTPPSQSTIRQLNGFGASVVLPTSQLTTSVSSSSQLNIGDTFTMSLISDRPDGLFPTVVSSYLQGGRSLGLVYSSRESIKESIFTGKGIYQSRKHGLWRKGETSGATQDLIQIHVDCDSDALEFSVVQHGTGFCHLERPSCFGEISGLASLESTLQSRLLSAPEGSYTRRLFDDEELLRSKIMEEADELCRADNHTDIAFEAADLLYFALTRCVAAGVSIADIEHSLDQKAKKITRRAGNAKHPWSSTLPKTPTPLAKIALSAPTANPDTSIRMHTYDLSSISPEQRSQLLRRPVLKSDEMISKVKPIVEDVRVRGDAALLELTAKFDAVQLTSTIIRPPYSTESMDLSPDVREAIDKAYDNIRKFHEAQAEKAPLVVETMPGVVCSRFSRPIARVGLYVPGGTAILPSTALMLGIPAQVAGCNEIVLATPPRSDGSISPEVMYVAKLVGASTILKAGGAQAVSAMAYGTQSVPKVDKIFGPGNQWVTAAKMLVQSDTDALVSIDMPAGPSEVLVSMILGISDQII